MLPIILFTRQPPQPTLFPYTTLFRSGPRRGSWGSPGCRRRGPEGPSPRRVRGNRGWGGRSRSEEHTGELQSELHLVCRLLLENKKTVAEDVWWGGGFWGWAGWRGDGG